MEKPNGRDGPYDGRGGPRLWDGPLQTFQASGPAMRPVRPEGRSARTSVLFRLDGVGPGVKVSRHVNETCAGAGVVDKFAHLTIKTGFLSQNTGGVSHPP